MVDWIQLDKVSGGSGQTVVTITASSYYELIQRVTQLTVTTNSGLQKVVSIAQNPYHSTTGITVNPLTLSWEQEGGIEYLHIHAEENWTWGEFPDWLSVSEEYWSGGSAGDHTVAITALANPSTQPLTGRISINCGEETAYVNCIQDPYVEPPVEITITPTSIDVPYEGSAYTITVSCDGTWNITSIPNWCIASQVSGVGDSIVTITVLENEGSSIKLGDVVFKDASGVNSATLSVVQEGEPYVGEYLLFTSKEDGSSIGLVNTGGTFFYSTDADTWYSFTSPISMPKGTSVYVRGENYTRLNNYFTVSGNVGVSGNIMSLFDDSVTILPFQGLMNLFVSCTGLTDASHLVFPTTGLYNGCFSGMFEGCTKLTSVPALSATTIAANCYARMFAGCTSLTTVPTLPATTLASGCYDAMFSGCTSLVTTPALPATTLAENCYRFMFDGCSNLNNVTMLATDVSARGCLSDWLYGVSSTGTFTKKSGVTLPTGTSGIPSGWTVINV